MITVTRKLGGGRRDYIRFTMIGLADEKPIGMFDGLHVANGSMFIEADTGKTCIYDEENQKWTVTASSEGGISYDLDGDGIDDDVATNDQIDDLINSLGN